MSKFAAFKRTNQSGAGGSSKIELLVQQYLQAELAVAKMEEDLKAAQSLMTNIRTQLLVKAMEEAGSVEFTTTDNHKVSLSHFVSGSLPREVEPRRAAFETLDGMGAGSLIKTNMMLFFDKGEKKLVDKANALLLKNKFTPHIDQTVNTNSLHAFIREQLKLGKETHAEKLGLFVGQTTKITQVKAKKK